MRHYRKLGAGLCALLQATAGCIVVGGPEYRDPEQTRPQLRRVSPEDPVYVAIQHDSSTVSVKFRFTVESEDLGERVQLVLLEDHGRTSPTRPYRQVLAGDSLDPGSLQDGPRTGVLTWEDSLLPDTECRRVTLLATHAFDGREPRYNCPLDPEDADTLTWFIARCRTRDSNCTFDDCIDSASPGISCLQAQD